MVRHRTGENTMKPKKDYSKQKTQRLTISMNIDSYNLLKAEAENLCMSISQYIVSEAVRGIKERKRQEELVRMMAVGKGLVTQQQKLLEAMPDIIAETGAIVEKAGAIEEKKKQSQKAKKKTGAGRSVKRNLTK